MDNRLFGLKTEGVLANLSLGGGGLVAPVNWPEGTRVRFEVDALEFETDGVIVFRQEITKAASKECRYGVKFQGLGLWDVWRLRMILKKRHSGPLAVL